MQINYKIIFFLCLILFSSLTFAFSSGTGTLANPFILNTCKDVQDINLNLSANYALGQDINCYHDTRIGGILWNSGAGFSPIGNGSTNFTGTLDGRNFIISNLHINRNTDYTGLFGSINQTTIKNLGLKDSNITGLGKVGSLAGSVSSSLIRNSFATGLVKGNNSSTGGLFGEIQSSTIFNLFFDGNVKGTTSVGGITGASTGNSTIKNTFVKGIIEGTQNSVGGITGWHNGMSGTHNTRLTNSYNLAKVSSPTGLGVGGITGNNDFFSSSIISSFSTGTVTGHNNVSKVVGYNSPQGYLNNLYCLGPGTETNCTTTSNQSNFYLSTLGVYTDWNDGNWIWPGNSFPKLTAFPYCNGPIDSNAQIYPGDNEGIIPKDENLNKLVNSNTPLKCEWYCKTNFYKGSGVDENKCIPYFSGGTGTLANPFIITTCQELQNINYRLEGNYILGNDIDCSETKTWNAGAGFVPIGLPAGYFRGSLNGNYKIIRNLYINIPVSRNLASTNDFVALFGTVDGAKLRNFGLKDANITGAVDVGGFVGRSMTNGVELVNLYFDGNLVGTSADLTSVGGIIASTYGQTTLKNSFSTGKINSAKFAGGLVGVIQGITISNSYSLMNISANYAGGLSGASASNSSINNSFSATNLSGLLTSHTVAHLFSPYTASNLYCINGSAQSCTYQPNSTLFYSNTHPVYSNWNDGNWIWTGNFFPQLTGFFYCSGIIDGNAEIYATDWTGLKPTDNLTNILSSTNTSRTCEWNCKTNYYKGSGLDENKCLPYACTNPIPNATYYQDDNTGTIPPLETNSLLEPNTTRKCQMTCNTNYYNSSGTCVANACINPIPNATYYQDDNTGTILETEITSRLEANTTRKCQMQCDTNYHIVGNICVADPIQGQYSCLGTIPSNATLWGPEEEEGLTNNTQRTVSLTNNPLVKCEYICLERFKKLDNNCVPSSWIIGKCGPARRYYYAMETFPDKETCLEGVQTPATLTLGEDIGDSVSWTCAGEIPATCTATRVDSGTPQMSSCSILSLTAGRESNGGMFVENYCSCETQMDLTLTDYDTGEVLATTPNSVACNEATNNRGFGFSPPITKDTLLQITGSIKNNVNECTNCELVTYYSYQIEKKEAIVPDNSIILVLLIIGFVSFVLTQKKRI